MAAIDFLEARISLAFAVEKLQHNHAADVFLQIRVDAGDSGANAAIRVTHFVAENLRRHHNQRQHRERDQRQLPVHAQHDAQNSHQHEEVFEDGDHARGKHFVQGVDIGRDARNQPADRIPVVKSHVHALQMAEDLAAQVEHHFLPGPLHEVSLQKFEHEGKTQQAKVNDGNLCDPMQGPWAQPTPQSGSRTLDRR